MVECLIVQEANREMMSTHGTLSHLKGTGKVRIFILMSGHIYEDNQLIIYRDSW